MRKNRPVPVTVVAWGAIILGAMMILSGSMGALVSFVMMTDMPASQRGGFPGPITFVFRHFRLFATLQIILATCLVAAGRALLHLRKWGALVVQGFALLGVLYVVGFTVIFVGQFTPLFFGAAAAPESAFAGLIAGGAIFNALLWGTPLVLAIYLLGTKRVRAMLT